MKPLGDTLLNLASRFAVLSLLAFGGANSVAPEIQRQAVSVNHWMSAKEFAALYALAQAAPGPNAMISTLVGFQAAGLPGALVATLALCVPSCLLTYFAMHLWERQRESRAGVAIVSGLAPVAVGLVCATALLLARAADRDLRLALVTVVAGGVSIVTRLNPLWLLAGAAALGLAGAFG